ncbi:MAG: hypothetical protein PHH85_03485 [Candidatus Methanoperedens sp.]|nr:hypothetical protein [Candidatus Methanoperedens sp.]
MKRTIRGISLSGRDENMKVGNLVSIAFLSVFAIGLFSVGDFEAKVNLFFGILIGLGFYDVYMRDKIGKV